MNKAPSSFASFSSISLQLKVEFQEELYRILNWWIKYMPDQEYGGFIGRVDGFGKAFPTADKGVILNTRLLWTFSTAAEYTKDVIQRNMAHRAYEYICTFFWDELEGGVFWMLDHKGNPIDGQKQIYAQAFAIYAFSAYYKLTGNKDALDKATELFWLIERYSLDTTSNGYLSAFARNWTPMSDIRLSAKDANEAKIMNTHLHVLEAYASFYQVHPFMALGDALENCLAIFEKKFFQKESRSLQIYFDENWNPKGDHISYGHNIEASWLLQEAAEILGRAETIKRIAPICKVMAEAVYEEALEGSGAINYEATPESGIIDYDRHWWVQAEGVIGFWNAFECTNDPAYVEASVNAWTFIKQQILDKDQGEWHWRVDKKGEVVFSENKAGPWKAPYHNVRMCIEMLNRLAS
jgi:mannobiose 2-epimerase